MPHTHTRTIHPCQVDEAWPTQRPLISTTTGCSLGGGGGPRTRHRTRQAAEAAAATTATAAAVSLHQPPSASATASAQGARPRMGAWSEGEQWREGELGVQARGAATRPHGSRRRSRSRSRRPRRGEARRATARLQAQTREAALRDLAQEWGCTDPKLAEALLRRKQKMQRAGRKTEQKRNQKDPMKRLAALQRKVAVLPPHAEAQHSPRQPLVLARHEPGAAENAGMRRLLSPRRLRLGDEGGYAAGCEEEIPQEIEDDLELDLASDELHDEPLRSFSSDAPNAKLRRSRRPPPRAPSAPLPRAELPTGSRSLNGAGCPALSRTELDRYPSAPPSRLREPAAPASAAPDTRVVCTPA